MLIQKIDSYYTKNIQARKKIQFYVTDAGKCPRAVYFDFKGYPKKKMEARTMRIFDMGDSVHNRIVSVLFKMGLVRAVEIRIPPQKLISGRADAILGKDELYVLEIKSCSHWKFEKLLEPDSDHIKQLQLYLHFFKIPKGIILYEDKNTQMLKEFAIEYDAKFVQRILRKFVLLKKKIENDIVPEIPKDLEKWRCRYCQFSGSCAEFKKAEKVNTGAK